MAKYYYGRNLDKYIQKLKLTETPGKSYNYQSVNTLLLGMALEHATGQSPATLLEKWIWQKPTWNMMPPERDSKKTIASKPFAA